MPDAAGCTQFPSWSRIATAALGLIACGGGETSGSEPGDVFGNGSCTALKAEQAVTLDADVRVLASGGRVSGGAGSLAPAVVPSGGEVYWWDERGSLFVERQDERVVELRHVEEPPAKSESVLGLAASSGHLYVGYAYGGFGDDGTLRQLWVCCAPGSTTPDPSC
jgi:hypothetical protein